MRFIHMSDLHLGKKVNEFSMIEEQEYILTKILNIIDNEKVEGVFISGDIYDKPVPGIEAIKLFDDFITKLAERSLKVFIISGNHDSTERIAFGARLMKNSNIYISPAFDGNMEPVTLEDKYGKINIYLLPFIKPANVKHAYEKRDIFGTTIKENSSDEDREACNIETYNEAYKYVVAHMDINEMERNILLSHQFVTGAKRSDSEDISVGGMDNVDVNVFEPFDYVALGHIHAPQYIGRETVRYCGTPLKYSFSEANHKKCVIIADILDKGNIKIREVPLTPKRDMRKIKGKYLEITAKEFYEGTATDDYIHVTLSDEEDVPEAMGKLRVIYPNIMSMEYDNSRVREAKKVEGVINVESKSPLELLKEFYVIQNNKEMSEEQTAFVEKFVKKIWEDK